MNQIEKLMKVTQERTGLSDWDLAQKIGVSVATVKRWKSGTQESIKIYNLMKICKATDTTITIDEYGLDVDGK